MDTEKRFFLAFALSMLVIIVFSWMNAEQLPETRQQPQSPTQQAGPADPQSPTISQEETATPKPTSETGGGQADTQPEVAKGPWNWLQPVQQKESLKTVTVQSDLYEIQFSPYGASPISWKLLEYDELFSDKRFLKLQLKNGTPQEQIKAQLELDLLEAHNGEKNFKVDAIDPYFKEGQAGLGIRWGSGTYDNQILYSSRQNTYTLNDQPIDVVFQAENNGIVITKTFRFYPNNYRIDHEIKIENESGERINFDKRNYYDVNWFGGFGFLSFRWDSKNQVITQLDGSVTVAQEESVLSELQSQSQRLLDYYNPPRLAMRNQNVGWVAVGQKYFLSAIVPHSLTKFALKGASSAGGNAQGIFKPNVGVRMYLDDILPDASHTDQFTLYVGPMDETNLTKAEAGLEDAHQIFLKRFIGPIAQLMLSLLQGFYQIVPNYGVAIILLTLVVKLLTLPLYHKQMSSMKKMQALQPQINALREQYKDDPQKQQKEQMELFRKHKVNPLAGCLPFIIILPIFISLYATFNLAVELRGAPFLGWINDLSSPDRAFYVPIGTWILPINILPIAYSVMMLINMNQNKMEGPNAAAMRIMPFIFIFFFWSIASGVILYFVVNILIDVVQRRIMDKFQKDEPALTPKPASGKGGSKK